MPSPLESTRQAAEEVISSVWMDEAKIPLNVRGDLRSMVHRAILSRERAVAEALVESVPEKEAIEDCGYWSDGWNAARSALLAKVKELGLV